MGDLDVDGIERLLVDVGRSELLTRFRSLRPDQIHSKESPDNPGDVVTEADLAAERRLREGLMPLVPAAQFLGEEGAAADPGLLRLLDGDQPVWVVDPLDGTRNFAAGVPAFGIIVALVVRGRTQMGFIHLPLEGVTLAAQAGAGARMRAGGSWEPLSPIAEGSPAGPPRGSIYTRFMSPEDRVTFAWSEQGSGDDGSTRGLAIVPPSGVSAVEYASLARRSKDFVLYHRLLPWDHAAGALIVAESGGVTRHPDGQAYAPARPQSRALAVADEAWWQDVHRRLQG